jgi:tRNA uridine 5-carboxymethylaminomethyl modification enzyme
LDIQYNAIKKIKGLENAKLFRPGYAIEYDYFPPTQLKRNLESKIIKNLFFAGQINGTTGYEEAAGQGIMAGINAHQCCANRDDFILKRDEAYIGVLIDDLITKGIDEPYRMFTSRAEYRILLRQDNSDERLTKISNEIGLACEDRMILLKKKILEKKLIVDFLSKKSINPNVINSFLINNGTSEINQKLKLIEIAKRPQISLKMLSEEINEFKEILQKCESNHDELLESTEIEIKYFGYIEREKNLAEKMKRLEDIIISENIDFKKIKSISTEGRQSLIKLGLKQLVKHPEFLEYHLQI